MLSALTQTGRELPVVERILRDKLVGGYRQRLAGRPLDYSRLQEANATHSEGLIYDGELDAIGSGQSRTQTESGLWGGSWEGGTESDRDLREGVRTLSRGHRRVAQDDSGEEGAVNGRQEGASSFWRSRSISVSTGGDSELRGNASERPRTGRTVEATEYREGEDPRLPWFTEPELSLLHSRINPEAPYDER